MRIWATGLCLTGLLAGMSSISCADDGYRNRLEFGTGVEDPLGNPRVVGRSSTLPAGSIWYLFESRAEYGERHLRLSFFQGDHLSGQHDPGPVSPPFPDIHGESGMLGFDTPGAYEVRAYLVDSAAVPEVATFIVSVPLEITPP